MNDSSYVDTPECTLEEALYNYYKIWYKRYVGEDYEPMVVPKAISNYISQVNKGNYLGTAAYVDDETAEEYKAIFSNQVNINNNVGLLNVINIKLDDIVKISSSDAADIGIYDDEYVNVEYYILKTSMKLRVERENDFKNGYNYLLFVIDIDDANKITDIYLLSDNIENSYFGDEKVPHGFNTPVALQ